MFTWLGQAGSRGNGGDVHEDRHQVSLRRAVALTSVATVFAALSVAARQPAHVSPETAGLSPAPLREATDLLKRYVAEQRIAGAVAAVARGGRIGYFETVGMQDLQTRTPMSARSLFRIYSMTRPITSVAVMMLQEEGRFQLDDPVAAVHPGIQERRGRRSAWRDAARTGPRCHRTGPAASHRRTSAENIGGLSARARAIA